MFINDSKTMPSTGFIIAEYVCPTIGAILSTLTFAAPIKSLNISLNNGSLGNLNPTPWVFMTGNTIGWLAYSFITLDLFVFFANAPGLIISIWLNAGAAKLQYHVSAQESSSQSVDGEAGENVEEQSNVCESSGLGNASQKPPPSITSHEWKTFLILLLWVVILSVASLIPMSKDNMKFVVGVTVNLNLIFFYAAPLSTILTVVQTKSSSTIHCPTMVMNTVNSFFWCVYSLAIRDYYILIPNGLGFLFGLLQMVAYLIYPSNGTLERVPTRDAQFLDEGGDATADIIESEII